MGSCYGVNIAPNTICMEKNNYLMIDSFDKHQRLRFLSNLESSSLSNNLENGAFLFQNIAKSI